jgi:hypothetical protein
LFSLLGFSVLFDCIKAPDSNAICRGITQDMTYAAVQAYTDAYKPDWERINFIVDILRSTPGEGPSWYHLLKKVSGGCNDLKNNEHMLVVVLTKQQAIKTGGNFQIVEYFLVEAIQIQSYGAEGNTELNLSTGDYIVVGVSDVQVWCGCDLLFRITDWHIPWHIILAVSKFSISLGASRSSRMEKCQPYVQSSVTSRDKQKLFVRFFGVLYRVFNKMNFMLLLDDDWEPLMDNYRPLGIKSLRFSTFSLGNMSPKIEEQKIQYTIHTIGGSVTAVHGFLSNLVSMWIRVTGSFKLWEDFRLLWQSKPSSTASPSSLVIQYQLRSVNHLRKPTQAIPPQQSFVELVQELVWLLALFLLV